jgi:hypothetical protein
MMNLQGFIFSLPILCGALWFFWHLKTYRWRILSAAYAGTWPAQGERKGLINLILRGDTQPGLLQRWAWSNYSGLASAAVSPQGIEFRLIFPLRLGTKPIFIPRDEWRAEECKWYLNSRSFKIKTKRVPDIELILAEDLMDWINQASARHTA